MWISVQPSQLAPSFDLRYRLSECNPWKGPQLGADFRPERSRWFQYIPMIFHKNQTKDTVFFWMLYSYYSCIPTCSHVDRPFSAVFSQHVSWSTWELPMPLLSRTASAASIPPAAHPPKVPAAIKKSGSCNGIPQMGMGQNPVPLVNIKITGKWMFIPLKMYL